MNYVKPSVPKGTRDFLPEQMYRRQFVLDIIKSKLETYGYEPLETPSIEKLEVLSGKYGEEGEHLLFKILKRGSSIEKVGSELKEYTVHRIDELVDLGLRYDLTVPLSRVVAMYQNEITLPFKRYQIQPVWRGDRPQKGRYREFFQCDADTVGSSSMIADAENICLIHDILSELGFDKFKIRINNRKILLGIVEYSDVDSEKGVDICVAIDKLDKIGIDGVRKELLNRNISEAATRKILPILEINGTNEKILADISYILASSAVGTQGIEEISEILSYMDDFGIDKQKLTIDLYLARGLSYYTGPIYESVVEEPRIGSLTGGGRYDELIGLFLGQSIPATGTTLGIERIIDVMTELDMIPEIKTRTTVLVTIFDENTKSLSLRIARDLRRAGINTEVSLNISQLKKQFIYANKKQIPFVVVIGPEELEQGAVTLKDMISGDQERISQDNLIHRFISLPK
ncbi:histidine--tRNA ligase [candidate division KSB1 bacterium]|nr:histidine--tRNA ligase [candidate division KSB1 bacterium]